MGPENTGRDADPVYRKAYDQRDGCDVEFIWLGEEDVEPDNESPGPIEQPTQIITPPLSEKDRDDRLRRAFGLTHDDPIPLISQKTLHTYYVYLMDHRTTPFRAFPLEEEFGPASRTRDAITIIGLSEPDSSEPFDEDGLICLARAGSEEIDFPLDAVEVKKKHPNFKLLSEYAYWLHNWPWADESDADQEELEPDVEPTLLPRQRLGASSRRRSSLVLPAECWGRRSGRLSRRSRVPDWRR